MKPVKISAYFTLLQIIILLLLVGVLAWSNKGVMTNFFYTTQSGELGLILNGLIVLLFLSGLLRIMRVFFGYAREQDILNRFSQRMRENVANPGYKLSAGSLIMRRYASVQLLSQQDATIDQNALAAIVAAEQSARFTLIRFVHNILILGGVFGTIVSLSVALVGAAGLLESPESLQKMGTIIGGMSTALSTTITAIVCYVFYSYFHLRLQDARTRLLANLEEVTTLYVLPRFRSIEGNLVHDVAVLARELRQSAESVNKIQERFLQAGERLQLAVDDLQTQVVRIGGSSDYLRSSSEDLRSIRDAIREGFRLGEQERGQTHDRN